ncbi:hypothetical protein EJB05_43281 [Eragrostis curvula]|uniref:Uncharacterized protein n=1 Tax=Eragrostis curvula TaxID=38414 RepID=A0A5J9TEH1_9POAL|nr:hypothetical protein EJB05_43281 [Eragrostis curvula]
MALPGGASFGMPSLCNTRRQSKKTKIKTDGLPYSSGGKLHEGLLNGKCLQTPVKGIEAWSEVTNPCKHGMHIGHLEPDNNPLNLTFNSDKSDAQRSNSPRDMRFMNRREAARRRNSAEESTRGERGEHGQLGLVEDEDNKGNARAGVLEGEGVKECVLSWMGTELPFIEGLGCTAPHLSPL